MNHLPFVSIVIPTFNRKDTLLECLESLKHQTYPEDKFEIIIVDDGSVDGTSCAVKEYRKYSKVKIIIVSQKNSGPGLARNLGVTKSTGEIIGFIEDDVIADKNWIKNAVTNLVTLNVDGIEGKTLLKDSQNTLRSFEGGCKIGFLPCNLFVKKEAFVRVGGYSSKYYDAGKKIYFREDADFGFKILEGSYKFIVREDVIVYHPLQFPAVKDYYRHVKRYYFDPLLHKEHPESYRDMIEVKNLGRITVHRPFHYSVVINILSWIIVVVGLFPKQNLWLYLGILMLLLTHSIIRYRYEKSLVPPVWKLQKTVAFLGLPFYYLKWFISGCYKFKNWKCLI